MKYDPFQQKAIDHINEGHSVIVSAPTGAGKTAIAEHVIENCLKRKEKVIYTAPIKALSNQKYRDFSKDYPEQVGILTGDVNINPDAPTLIMTTEIFRNQILETKSSLKKYSWIIFDEIHYLDDRSRGSVWEESLIFLPDHMNILGLSATIPNLEEFVKWLKTIHHKPVKIVKESKRPVPLHFYFQCQGQVFDDVKNLKKFGYQSLHVRASSAYRLPRSAPIKPNRLSPLIKNLQELNNLPCIYFAFSRRRTETLAEEMELFNFLSPKEQKQIETHFKELCEKFDIAHEPSTCKLKPLIEKGIAYHHAGMLPTLKEVVERLFATRLIKIIFTTETFALGINMPARTVIFDELKKYADHSFRIMKTRDFYQMAGRAGRRSIDTEGHVYCRINPHYISIDDLQRVIYGKPEKIVSRFNASYATILNLYYNYGEKLYDVYPLSFHFFQEQQFTHKKALKLLRSKVDLLKELGLIRKSQVTEKGLFASKVYGYELILSELFSQKILQKLSSEELCILCLAVVYEPRKGVNVPRLSKKAAALQVLTDDLIVPILRIEKKFRVKPYSKLCHFHLSNCMEGWLEGESFDEIFEYTQADEGEIVRYFRMVIQVLREVSDAFESKEFKSKVHKAIATINRDVIDARKQLQN